ncbi:alpha/beta hydrolase [Candidatus Uabimicrobium amorphum]|uniref:Alpha/beta hydrolase n=1 Tax=Uabimicrobium amorphum TaxID=2596890 RepID=A0A5S9F0V7_UABAM|nr:alpha/beta hydrolase [Candidatus Uabimicrobium amorphum]BBM81906.1 alpha/beta hydrolase [Candidatus Uabimicrobium amorphum]
MIFKVILFYSVIFLWIWLIFRWAARKLACNMLFHPDKEHLDTPKQHSLDYEDVYFTTRDKKKLHGWFVPCENSVATVLFLHGNAGNISNRLDEIALWHCIKVSVFIVDYRGYGKSKGSTSERGLYLDSEAAYDYLVQERSIPPEKIVCFGRSLGGAVAIRLSLNREFGAVIVASTFTSLNDLIRGLFVPWLASFFCWASPFKFRSIDLIGYVTHPLLILHGTEDELIPYVMAKELYESASKPKLLYPVTDGKHNDTFIIGGKKYWYVIENFIKKSLTELKK